MNIQVGFKADTSPLRTSGMRVELYQCYMHSLWDLSYTMTLEIAHSLQI